MIQLEEIEIGPHFVTFYSNNRSAQVPWLPDVYRAYIKKFGEDYQQEGFAHEPNDPKVYHRHEEPRYKSHFHIRTEVEPTLEKVYALRSFLEAQGATISPGLVITYLNIDYPPRLPEETYLHYIERLKSNG